MSANARVQQGIAKEHPVSLFFQSFSYFYIFINISQSIIKTMTMKYHRNGFYRVYVNKMHMKQEFIVQVSVYLSNL